MLHVGCMKTLIGWRTKGKTVPYCSRCATSMKEKLRNGQPFLFFYRSIPWLSHANFRGHKHCPFDVLAIGPLLLVLFLIWYNGESTRFSNLNQVRQTAKFWMDIGQHFAPPVICLQDVIRRSHRNSDTVCLRFINFCSTNLFV